MSAKIRIVVYGTFSSHWATALAPGAPVWRGMPEVGEVCIAQDEAAIRDVPPARDGVETVILPLTELNTLTRPRHYRALVPDERAIKLFANKATFSVYAKKYGLSHLCPQTYTSNAEVAFPCVVKRLLSHSGIGVAAAHSREELQTLLADWRWRGQHVTVQALLPGREEYVTHCVCKKGNILWHTSYAYMLAEPDMIRSAPNTPSPRPVTPTARALAQIESFLAPLAYNGPCNVDYKLAPNGDIAVFEINPRFGGSLMRPENVDSLRQALTILIANAEAGEV
jgi:carbamoylphosphate synthase large subunit